MQNNFKDDDQSVEQVSRQMDDESFSGLGGIKWPSKLQTT